MKIGRIDLDHCDRNHTTPIRLQDRSVDHGGLWLTECLDYIRAYSEVESCADHPPNPDVRAVKRRVSTGGRFMTN